MTDPLAPLSAIWCTAFDCSQLPTHTLVTYRDQLNFMPSDQMVLDAADTRLNLYRIQLRGNDNTSWVTQHAIQVDVWNQWQVRVRDGPAVEYVEALSYPSDEYIRWYRGITRVYIGNPANRDTRAHGYQPAGVDRRMMEVDDMTSVAIREPPSSPSQIAAVMKKVQTIIRRCMVSIGGTLGCIPSQHDIQATFPVQPSRRRPREHIPDRGAHGVKRDMQSYSLGLILDPQSLPSGFGTSQMPPAPSSGFTAFQSPHPSAYGFGRFRAPSPPGTAGASTPHQPISQASSFDEEEGQDALGCGHRVGKKTVRFTPSDWLTYADIIFYFS
ncbi:hypothetical protein M9H77_24131 [Catharanthus roseus]|uniref:Uncharacterized protein n=1 Tax=Catharanthus roseus TaxID=4058 RepID=A0ACC0AZE2_CATRO|nr:hypothetical protein M9H77_24131 [Catharanthus roseus]